ncbi:hypothetical protein JA1_005451 [Spathaspora sp. JA1]|nr:hypothetical protein JA1_005451 [Spathaspora sp. JA1]
MISINSDELVEYYLNSVAPILSSSLSEYVRSDRILIQSKIEEVLSKANTGEASDGERSEYEAEEFEPVNINEIVVDEDAFLSQVENTIQSKIDEPAVEQFMGEQKLHRVAFLKEINEKGLSLRGVTNGLDTNDKIKDSCGSTMNY